MLDLSSFQSVEDSTEQEAIVPEATSPSQVLAPESTSPSQVLAPESTNSILDLSGLKTIESSGLLNKAQNYINQYMPSNSKASAQNAEQVQQPIIKIPGEAYTEHKTSIGEDITNIASNIGNAIIKFEPALDPNNTISEAIIKRIQSMTVHQFAIGAGVLKYVAALPRFGSLLSGQNTAYIDEVIDNIDKRVDQADRIRPGSAALATLATYVPQVAAGFYNGAAILPQMLIQGTLGAVRSAAEKNDVGTLNNIVDTLKNGAMESVMTGGVMSTIKLAQYGIAQKFMPEEIWNLVNKNSENFDTLVHLAKYAKENDIKVSDLLFRGFGNDNMPAYIKADNYWALRDTFKGINDFSKRTIDLLTDSLDKIGKGDKLDFTDYRNVNAYERTIRESIIRLRQSYKEIEGEMYTAVKEKVNTIPDQIRVDTELNEFLQDSASDSPIAATGVVRGIVNRFKKPFAEDTKALAALKDEKYAILAEINAKTALAKAQGAKGDLIESQLTFKEIQGLRTKLSENSIKAKDLRDTRYMTLSELMDTSKLLNAKIYKPGGAISIKDADELRVLRNAKEKVDSIIEDNLQRIAPDISAEWQQAKSVTKTRSGIFGAKDSGSDTSSLFANALAAKDMNKVFNMITDSHDGVKHLAYIRSITGPDSELFKKSSRLYLEDKLGILKGTAAWDKVDRPFSETLSDFNKASASFKNITKDDYTFIAENFSKSVSKDLESLGKLIHGYADIANSFKEANYLPSPWMHIKSQDSVSRALKLVGDSITYATAKGARAAINNMPMLRTITGSGAGTVMGINKAEEQGLKDGDEWGTILGYTAAGGAGGYAAGIMLRHILEPNVDKAMRHLTAGNTRAAQAEIDRIAGLIDSVGNQEVKIKGQPRDGKTFRDYFPNFFSTKID